MNARFVHVNVIARDWEALVSFYQRVFGVERVGPERDLSGEWIERGTGIAGTRIRGAHLRMPGFGDDGPTLEIYSYEPERSSPGPMLNRPGLAHLAFAVDDVASARDEVLRAGGIDAGEMVDVEVPGAGTIRFVYMRDPEGNLLELQNWRR